MKPARSIAAIALLAAAPAFAQEAAPAQPRLIVAISVDQFSGDLFAQYRSSFTGGLARLATEGAVFPAGYQAHAATETCPGHSTILTGSNPARTGIIANNWIDQGAAREDKVIYCSEDESVAGSSSDKYTVSPVHLKVPTLGMRMKAANPASRNVAVSGKDRGAVMMAGRDPDQIWWWGGQGFVTYPGKSSAAAAAVNAAVTRAIATARAPLELSPRCAALARPVAVGGGTVGDGRFAREAGDRGRFRASPEMDGATLALAAGLIAEMRLGQGSAPDMLSISLSATDYVGHGYGTEGSEMCLQMAALDRSLGDFFARLDGAGIDYAVMLTADHGGHDLPERAREQAAPDAQRVTADLAPKAVSQRIGAALGLTGELVFGDGSFGDMWVSRSLSAADKARVVAEAKKQLSAHPQVQAVLTRAEIMATPMPRGPADSWTLLERARASFDPERSGDYVVALKPRVTPIANPRPGGGVATHGSFWDYDRRVPILFWLKGMTPFEQPLAITTTDIMPTLAALIGLPVPANEIDGVCRDLDAGPGTTCR
nr:alkaline phosphatase family protein [Sphingomonas gilva]